MKLHGNAGSRLVTLGLKLIVIALGLAAVSYVAVLHDEARSPRAGTSDPAFAHAAEAAIPGRDAAEAASLERESTGRTSVVEPVERLDASRECRRDSGIDTTCIFH